MHVSHAAECGSNVYVRCVCGHVWGICPMRRRDAHGLCCERRPLLSSSSSPWSLLLVIRGLVSLIVRSRRPLRRAESGVARSEGSNLHKSVGIYSLNWKQITKTKTKKT